ncbi:PIG-L family deacetylase [candidate division KSB1 bacterium]|nr:PIG-L family deacetylase [candidate division KSB1 bacterium]
MKKKRSILVVAAHPDDEVLGCGGTTARLAEEGHDIYVAILGEGITSRHDRREDVDRKMMKELQDQSWQASRLLGVKDLFLYDLPDNRFDTVPLLEVVKLVEDTVNKTKPDIVFTHHGSDLNIDHTITNRAVLTATRPMPGSLVKEIYAFEISSSTEWSFNQVQCAFRPNVFFAIRDTVHKKMKAMEIYHHELRVFPHPRSIDFIEINARHWGSVVGIDYAEAFELIRMVKPRARELT